MKQSPSELEARPRLAFYAPMKSPNSNRPSGDRTIGSLFIRALETAGFHVEIASELRTWEGAGDPGAQKRIRINAERIGADLIDRYAAADPSNRPVGWFSYHPYHKSPDWIGPSVCRALDIPYFCAEASVSPGQKEGPWKSGHDQSLAAIRQARMIFNLNPRDLPSLSSIPGVKAEIIPLIPFLDADPVDPDERFACRQQIASRLRIDVDRYWLVCVAMMRDDAKLSSYSQLARTMDRVERKDWLLLIVGDGAAELQVRDCFRLDSERQIFFLGRRDSRFIRQLMSVSDLLVWPAIREAIGMVALEALSAGLPAVCGRSGGIGQIIHHGHTGLLVDDPEHPEAAGLFAEAIESLLECPGRLAAMSAESIRRFRQYHRIQAAARSLRDHILPFLG